MLSREEILKAVKNGRNSESIDSRDYSRLVEFFPVKDWEPFGFSLKKGKAAPVIKELTEDAIKKELQGDLAFAFKKALDCRGLSASAMYAVVKMWLWILEDDLQHCEDFRYYGLPLLKKIAVKYGFDNPIGDDNGDEKKYSEMGDDDF